jgi:Kef-type K+ transport system membrane component KefB
VNAIALLTGLLVLSYLGSFVASRRTETTIGLSSGIEYVALGFLLGPQALGMVEAKDLNAFEPVVQVAIGWLAFGVGLEFGFARERPLRFGRLLLGSASAAWTGGAIALALWLLLPRIGFISSPVERMLLAGGIGAACAETTRHSVGWVVARHQAQGPLSDTLGDLAQADDLLPLLAVGVLFALDPNRNTHVAVPLPAWPLVTLALAAALGGLLALLVRSDVTVEDTWTALFGVSLLAVGASARLGLSSLTTCFLVGLTISLLSRRAPELRSMVAPTEGPVLLPALVLAGARLDFRVSETLVWVALVAVAVRLGTKLVMGWWLAAFSAPARAAGPWVGLSLVGSGSLSMCFGLAFALRFPGTVGDSVLAVAVASATVGEFIGPARLRRALQAAGEIEPQAAPRELAT